MSSYPGWLSKCGPFILPPAFLSLSPLYENASSVFHIYFSLYFLPRWRKRLQDEPDRHNKKKKRKKSWQAFTRAVNTDDKCDPWEKNGGGHLPFLDLFTTVGPPSQNDISCYVLLAVTASLFADFLTATIDLFFTWSETPRSKRASSCCSCSCCCYVVLLYPWTSDDNVC